MDGSPHCAPRNKVPPGTIERPSGPPQPLDPSAGCRVVSPPAGSMEYHPYMGVIDDRPVCDTPQCETTPILLPHPRSTSRLRKRLPQHVVHPRRVGVPALPSRLESSGRSQRDPKSLHDPGLPPRVGEVMWFSHLLLLLTQPPLALPPLDHLLRQPHFSRFHGGVHALNFHEWRLSSVSSENQDCRDELRTSCPAASESPLHAYTSHEGSLFCRWCRGRGVNPIDATIPLIVDILIHLRQDKGFSDQRCRGAFASPTKTLLPIALASAKRVGELHALSYRVSHSLGWKEVSFSFVPGFVAKTQDQSSLEPRLENFTVLTLPQPSSSPNGRLLCPVRTVKCHLNRTSQHRPRRERLFLTSGHTRKEISNNTVSFWLLKVISLVYQLSGRPLPSNLPLG